MSGGLPIFACAHCGHTVFPARLLCPRCGNSEWQSSEVAEGVVEESTVLRRAPGTSSLEPVHLGSVRVAGDVVVVARLEPGVDSGTSVRLEYRDGVPVAHAREP